MSHAGRLGVLTPLLSVLLGCSTQPMVVRPDAVSDLGAVPVAVAERCPRLGEFVDARPDQDMGKLSFRDFEFPVFPSWFETQLRNAFPEDGNLERAPMRLELLRSYLETNASTLSFTVVIRATIEPQHPQVFRGSITKVNWWGTQSEFGNYIESASDQAIARLRASCGTRHGAVNTDNR